MTFDEFERRLEKAFSDRIRLVAENPHGQFSSAWMFWGNKSDFYFGAKIISDKIKVSLHENGRGYVAYHKPYFEKKRAEGIVPGKSGTRMVAARTYPFGSGARCVIDIACRLLSRRAAQR